MSPLDDAPHAQAGNPVTLNGVPLVLRPDGALWWPARRTLVVADLHLEKGTAIGRGTGQLLPPYDSRATLGRLARTIAALDPACVICLGDSFHDRKAAERIVDEDRRTLAALVAGRNWIWIVGNHDPAPSDAFGGKVADFLVDGALVFRHEATPGAAGEISGHYHPKARVETRARSVSARCFVHDSRRLILPAFGAYAGGLDVMAPAIRTLLERRFWVDLTSRRGIYRFPAERLARVA